VTGDDHRGSERGRQVPRRAQVDHGGPRADLAPLGSVGNREDCLDLVEPQF
jgi:hypothetical protein